MSTKQNPGAFDCYKKLRDDEPYFLLRAKDPDAPALVEEWARRRALRSDKVGDPKIPEAIECAATMRAWRAREMSARPCGCDPGAGHTCEVHSASR